MNYDVLSKVSGSLVPCVCAALAGGSGLGAPSASYLPCPPSPPPSAALQRARGDPRRGFHRSTLWSIPTLGLRTALDHNRDGLSRDRIAGARLSAEIRCTADGWTRIVGSTGRGQREKLGRKPAPKVSPCAQLARRLPTLSPE